jgi:hypothetical protein
MIMSLRHGPVPLGRRMFEVSAEETKALAQPLGLRCAGGQCRGHYPRLADRRGAEQVGVRWTVIFGVLMIAAGLLLSSLGGRFDLYLGHGLFMGFSAMPGSMRRSMSMSPDVYVARWFDRRRGSQRRSAGR